MLENISAKVKNTKVFGVPIGDAILLLVGLGVSDALIPIVNKVAKLPIISGAGLAALVKIPAVEKVLGPTMSNVLSATSIAVGTDEQFAVRGKVESLLSSVTGVVPGLAPSTPVHTSGIPESISTPVVNNMSEQERRILATMS